MTHLRPLALALCVVFAPGLATAQLKLPGSATGATAPRAPSGTLPATPAATAPEPSSDVSEKEAAGKLAAAGWLTLLDRKDWGTAWETSAGLFRTTVPLATWMDGIPKVRTPLGNLVERAPAESQYRPTLEGRPAGDYVSVIFASKFDQKEVQEIVTTVREPDGKWRVTGYSTR